MSNTSSFDKTVKFVQKVQLYLQELYPAGDLAQLLRTDNYPEAYMPTTEVHLVHWNEA